MNATNGLSLTIGDEHAMAALAASIAVHIKPPAVIALSGELGAGKTLFARAFINSLCDTEEAVISPTFMLQQSYQTKLGHALHHFDFYRVKHALELAEIGFEEAVANDINLIEWPEIASSFLPRDTLHLAIEHHGDGSERLVNLSSSAPLWSNVFNQLDQRKRAS